MTVANQNRLICLEQVQKPRQGTAVALRGAHQARGSAICWLVPGIRPGGQTAYAALRQGLVAPQVFQTLSRPARDAAALSSTATLVATRVAMPGALQLWQRSVWRVVSAPAPRCFFGSTFGSAPSGHD